MDFSRDRICLVALVGFFTVGALFLLGGTGLAAFPEQPITYLVTFDPGGQSDVEARRQQPLLEELLGVKVLVTYKVGGGGALGWSELVNSRADGYTIAGINIPHIVMQPLVRDNAGYKTEQLEPISWFQNTPIGLAVQPNSPFETLDDFIAYAKDNPGVITVAGSATWSGHHLAMLQLQALADITVTYIPFSGAAPQVASFLGGHTTAILANSNDLVQHEDNMRVLAIGSRERFDPLPDVPTFIELGYDMTPSIDRGIAAPPGTPPEVIAALEEAFLAIVERDDVRAQMLEQGFVPLAMGAAESQAYIDAKQDEFYTLLRNLGEIE